MSWVAVGVGVASVGIGLYSAKKSKDSADKEADLQRQSGQVKKAAGELEATVLDQQATNAIGAAQRDAKDIQRSGRLAESRAIALAAASGGGASTAPSVGKLVGDIAKESSYNAARAIYTGEERGRLFRLQAREQRQMGEFAVVGGNLMGSIAEQRGTAAELATAGTIAGTGSSMYLKYGGRGPDTQKTSDFGGYTGLDSAGGPSYG